MTHWKRLIIPAWVVILGAMLVLWASSARSALGCSLCAGRQGINIDVVQGTLFFQWFRRDRTSPPEFLVDPWTHPKSEYILTMAMMPSARPGHERSISLKHLGSITWGRGIATTHLLRIHTSIGFLVLLHTAAFILLYLLAHRHDNKTATPSP